MESGVPTISDITLVADLTDSQMALLARYATRPRSIRPHEWREALAAFDVMGNSTLMVNGQTRRFAAFYDEFVEDRYSAEFIESLQGLTDAEANGFRLVADFAERVFADLEQAGVPLAGSVGERCLIAFCHYWWTSFGKGYVREVTIFRDLTATGIAFDAHDLRDKRQRFSPYDLLVSGWSGDIKTSTYFLHTRRGFPLVNDFYIVGLFDETTRRKLDIVIMKPAVWEKLDGAPLSCELREVSRHFPRPTQVTVRNETLIVVEYEAWKRHVLQYQRQTRGETR
jgi:hypothetical protein